MKHLMTRTLALLLCAAALVGCAARPSGTPWVTLLDGEKGLENWNRIGDANWRSEGGAIVADNGKGGYLVSKESYQDFMIYAEFWAATDTNSGIFIRATNPGNIGANSAYEVNIWDIRPDPSYGTGGIVDFAKVPVPILNKAGGKWNVMQIYAKGNQISVKLNGEVTATLFNDKFPRGPFALQYGPGVQGARGGPIKWRNVQIRPL